MLVLVQLFSLGLNRWADVVQTRTRGRTGGIRQAREQSLNCELVSLRHRKARRSS